MKALRHGRSRGRQGRGRNPEVWEDMISKHGDKVLVHDVKNAFWFLSCHSRDLWASLAKPWSEAVCPLLSWEIEQHDFDRVQTDALNHIITIMSDSRGSDEQSLCGANVMHIELWESRHDSTGSHKGVIAVTSDEQSSSSYASTLSTLSPLSSS